MPWAAAAGERLRRGMVGLVLGGGTLLAVLACGDVPATPAPTPAPTRPPTAADLYTRNCAVCHPGGHAGVGPSLVATTRSDAAIAALVRHGRANMPAYGPDRLSDADLTALIAYIRTLK